jgi:hypothetical protein
MKRWIIGVMAVAAVVSACAATPEGDRRTADREPPTTVKPESPASDLKRDGVITPPPVGDEAAVKTPRPEDTGRTPVLKPPGTPGGDPSVRPK